METILVLQPIFNNSKIQLLNLLITKVIEQHLPVDNMKFHLMKS